MRSQFLGLFCAVFAARSAAAEPLAQYMTQRSEIVAEELAVTIFNKTMPWTDKEAAASTIFDGLVAAELSRVKKLGVFPPRQNFIVARDVIGSSPLIPILTRMPKGAVLHLHSNAVLPVDWLVSNASYRDDCYVYGFEGADSRGERKIHQRKKKARMGANAGGRELFYTQPLPLQLGFFAAPPAEGSGWETCTGARERSGNRTRFDAALVDSMRLPAPKPGDTVDDLWVSFEDAFGHSDAVVSYLPVFKAYTQRSIEFIASQGISHIELRVVPPQLFDLTNRNYTTNEVVGLMSNAIAAAQRITPGVSVSLIICALRFFDSDVVARLYKEARAAMAAYPNLVVGFDLVGQEDPGHTLEYFVDPVFAAGAEPVDSGAEPNMPFFFHAGETLRWTTSENLVDALLLNTRRIGHGYALSKHPLLLQEVSKRGVSIEVCPISNQVLGLVGDLRNHPAANVFAASGAPITISPDDPALFGSDGVVSDWYEAVMGLGYNLPALKYVVQNSIRGSAVTEARRAEMWSDFDAKWAVFVDSLLTMEQKEG